MNSRMKGFVVGLTVASLVIVGVIALAGNGRGARQTAQQAEGTCSSDACDGDCVRALDGSGSGSVNGYGKGLSASRPMEGTGHRAGQASGRGMGRGTGSCSGSYS